MFHNSDLIWQPCETHLILSYIPLNRQQQQLIRRVYRQWLFAKYSHSLSLRRTAAPSPFKTFIQRLQMAILGQMETFALFPTQ